MSTRSHTSRPGFHGSGDPPVPVQTGQGAQASHPMQLSVDDWRRTLIRTAKQVVEDRVTLVAAGMAFYWFLAVFPLLIAVMALSGLMGAGTGTASVVEGGMRSVLPGDAVSVLTGAIGEGDPGAERASLMAAVVGLVLALWSASGGMAAVQLGLDVAYDVPVSRSYLRRRAVALLLMVGALVLGGIATALMVFGRPIGDAIWDAFPLGPWLGVAWLVARWAGAVVAVGTLFAVFYYVAPNRESPRWQWISPGGVLATLVWVGASASFSVYVSNFATYARTYGSLSGVIVLILWLFMTALAILVGGEFNAELERQSAIRAGEAAEPG